MFTNLAREVFFYQGAVLWNSLPLSVSEAATLSSFRNLYFNFNDFCLFFAVLLLYIYCTYILYIVPYAY